MTCDLTDPIFTDEAAAWAHFEAIRWPDGPVDNVETIPNVDANQRIVVREHRGIVERHPFTHDTP